MASSRSKTTSRVSHATYRGRLEETGVSFYEEYEDFKNPTDQEVERIYSVCAYLDTEILKGLDEGTLSQLDADQQNQLIRRSVRVQTHGYTNLPVILGALRTWSESRHRYNRFDETACTNFLERYIFSPFRLYDLFSFTRGVHLWRIYDPALSQIQPSRGELTRPKPDFAFGIRIDGPTGLLRRKLREWQYNCVPSVNLLVHENLAEPFFIYESKGSGGSRDTAEHQVYNGMIQAHDILCSLNLQESLHIFGMTQVGAVVNFYVSFGINRTEDGKRYCKYIRVVELKAAVVRIGDFEGFLTCWRFIEQIRLYGRKTFTPAVLQAMEAGFPSQVPSSHIAGSPASSTGEIDESSLALSSSPSSFHI